VQEERDVNRDAALAQDDIAASAPRIPPAADEPDGHQVRRQQVMGQDENIAALGHWAAEADIAMLPAHNGPTEDDIAPKQHRGQPIAERRAAETAQQPITPPTLPPTFANIPAELRALRNWVMWRYVQKPDKKKPDKVPFQPNGKHAKTNDSSTWNTFDNCRAAYNGGRFDGIGFVFDGKVGDDGLCYAGVDFDDCIENGSLLEPARSRIERLQTYTERSVSGAGIHSIIRAKPGTTTKHISPDKGRSIEIYSKERYFTFTGASWAKPAAQTEPAPPRWSRSFWGCQPDINTQSTGDDWRGR
jgi:hypothetical protein